MRIRSFGALACAVLMLAACAREGGERPLPAACAEGEGAVLAALRAAPRPVRMHGIPLSACLRRHSTGADLQAAGTSLVSAAGALSDAADRGPEGRAALELGYLVGAVERGTGGPGAPGTNTEIVRRIELELDAVKPSSRALKKGLRAGRASG